MKTPIHDFWGKLHRDGDEGPFTEWHPSGVVR